MNYASLLDGGLYNMVLEHREREPKLERQIEEYREMLRDIWLYVDWKYVTKNLTTEQKELWLEALEDGDEGSRSDWAWWRL